MAAPRGPPNMCKECDVVVDSHADLFKHIRKKHNLNVQDSGHELDQHGHWCYCFECCSRTSQHYKSHRSFNSLSAFAQHMRDVHGLSVQFDMD